MALLALEFGVFAGQIKPGLGRVIKGTRLIRSRNGVRTPVHCVTRQAFLAPVRVVP